jgi:hypothetical protein
MASTSNYTIYNDTAPLLNFPTPVVQFRVSEEEANVFMARCQALVKWNIKQGREQVQNKKRKAKAGA